MGGCEVGQGGEFGGGYGIGSGCGGGYGIGGEHGFQLRQLQFSLAKNRLEHPTF